MKTREELVAEIRRQRQEIEQIFIDFEYYNSIHPSMVPIDPDPYGELRRYADAFDRCLEKEDARAINKPRSASNS